MVGRKGKHATVDPIVGVMHIQSWRLWIWEGGLLSRLTWDPGKLSWPSLQENAPYLSFFEYTVLIGRHILLSQQCTLPKGLRAWLHARFTHAFLRRFWTGCTHLQETDVLYVDGSS